MWKQSDLLSADHGPSAVSFVLYFRTILIFCSLFHWFHNELLSSVWDVMNITLAHVYLFPQWGRRCSAWVCVREEDTSITHTQSQCVGAELIRRHICVFSSGPAQADVWPVHTHHLSQGLSRRPAGAGSSHWRRRAVPHCPAQPRQSRFTYTWSHCVHELIVSRTGIYSYKNVVTL